MRTHHPFIIVLAGAIFAFGATASAEGDGPGMDPATANALDNAFGSSEGKGAWTADTIVKVMIGDDEDPSSNDREAPLDVRFEFDSADIDGENKSDLDAAGEALQKPELESMRFLLTGHTDDVGSPAYNKDLSLRRAQSARSYLIDKYNVDAGRLEAIGMGSDRPARDNKTKVDRAYNRRVTLEPIQ